MSRQDYIDFHKQSIQKNDMITLEETDPGNHYKTISYTRFNVKNDENNDDNIQISPVKIVYWNLDSAKRWFDIDNRDPETNSSILSYQTFLSRIEKQLKLKQTYEEGYFPDDSKIKNLFLMYIMNKSKISDENLTLLHNFFHIDNTILMKWEEDISDNSKHREFANKIISNAENGSWFVRRTSIKESDVVKTRVITFKSMNGSVKHIMISHVYGYGYVLPLNITSGQEMPFLGSGNYMTVNKELTFPSFISFIKYLNQHTNCDFVLNKLIFSSHLT